MMGRTTHARFGRIESCVTDAGGPPVLKFADATVAEWRAAVELNFMSTLMKVGK